MTTTATINGTGYDLLASRHIGRSSGAPTALASTGVSVATRHTHGGAFAMALDAAGRVTTSESNGQSDPKNTSAAAALFG